MPIIIADEMAKARSAANTILTALDRMSHSSSADELREHCRVAESAAVNAAQTMSRLYGAIVKVQIK